MPLSAWIARFEGREIRVVNTWFSGAKLYVDGVCVGTNHDFFVLRSDTPQLVHDIKDAAGNLRRVQIFVRGLLTVQIAIFVDDVQYGGEVLDITVDTARFGLDAERVKALGTGTGSTLAVPATPHDDVKKVPTR